MKKNMLISALLSLVISFAVIGGYHHFQDEDKGIRYVNQTTGNKVLYAANKDGEIMPLDFTKTTNKILEAVVHVKSIGSTPDGTNQYRSLPDPFKDFFEDSPFGSFFERRLYRGYPDGKTEQLPKPMPLIGSGSGVIINENGYIITNYHVIDNADEIEVTLHNNGTYKASVVGTDPATDLALLQIKANNLKALPFVNSDDVKVGEWVLAVGNPFSLTSTVTAGIVSAKARNININRHKFAVESFIQTDAAINPGNSGGALVNLNGDLIGINTAIASRTGTYNGYGFAVPSNIASKVVEDLLKYGVVQRGMLGVTIRTMNGTLAKEKKIDLVSGVYVEEVKEKSAAAKAGLKSGDIIIELDGKSLKSSPELQELIARKRPGDKVKLNFLRDGKERTESVVLENSIGSTAIKKVEHREMLHLLGAELETIAPETANKLSIQGGVKIIELHTGRLRQHTQVKEGFIITHIDGKQIKDVENFLETLESKNGGVMLEGVYEDLPGRFYYAFGMDS